MGFFDYVADLYSSLSVTEVEAEERQYGGSIGDKSGQQSDSEDTRSGGVGTAQHDRGATTRGGASTKTPHSGTNEESDEEKEVNTADAEKANARTASSGDDDQQEASRGEKAAPDTGDDEDAEEEAPAEEEAEEEDEDDDEPKDPKPILEAECLKSSQCNSKKHHYDECAERVQQQIDDNGKADEDCVEEYFHMMHCATQCAAGKLFKQLR